MVAIEPILNRQPVDPPRLRILILSPPKTGNTWLRLMLRETYGLRDVDLPVPFDAEAATALGHRWVSHAHVLPTRALVQWLISENITVITTVRHPGDTLVSLFHYLRWSGDAQDPAFQLTREDGDKPGSGTHRFAQSLYAQLYAIAEAWFELGSHLVRYEDLLADPLAMLRSLCTRIQPAADSLLIRATLLGSPAMMRSLGGVDPRHIRKASSEQWRADLPTETIAFLRTSEPFCGMALDHGYSWDAAATPTPSTYDYTAINPFGARTTFDNGDPVSLPLMRLLLEEAPSHPEFLIHPWSTRAGGFWSWLSSPAPAALADGRYPPATLTNVMLGMHRWRHDLISGFPDPLGDDRLPFAHWFTERAQFEFGLSWRLIAPTLKAVQQALAIEARADVRGWPRGRINRVALRDARGSYELDQEWSLPVGAKVVIEMELFADDLLPQAVIGLLLRDHLGRPAFGTNSLLLGQNPGDLSPGTYRAEIHVDLTLSPGIYVLSIGLACRGHDDRIVPVDRRYDLHTLNIIGGPRSHGEAAWCATSIGLVPVADRVP